MNKKIKKSIIISLISVLIIIAIVSTFFIIKYFISKNNINNVYEIYSEENIQDRLDNRVDTEDTIENNNLMLNMNGEDVIGVIKIDKINFEGLIYKGTSLQTLKKGVGHFENSAYFEGNVCLAAHNTKSYWAKLHILQKDDKITYTSFLGTKEYKVYEVKQISETDWTLLENTDENILTLITCVKGKPELRLAVQAIEVN